MPLYIDKYIHIHEDNFACVCTVLSKKTIYSEPFFLLVVTWMDYHRTVWGICGLAASLIEALSSSETGCHGCPDFQKACWIHGFKTISSAPSVGLRCIQLQNAFIVYYLLAVIYIFI